MRRILRWLGVVGIVAFLASVVWWVLQVTFLDAKERTDASSYGQFVLGAVGLLFAVASPVIQRIAPPPPRSIEELSDILASSVGQVWEDAAVDRRLLSPAPLPVRWKSVAEELAGPRSAALRDRRFDPLPGLRPTTAATLRKGTRRTLHAVYGGLPSGRLLLVGPAGAGKSAAAIFLLLDALKYRDQRSAEERRLIPVPVLFTLREWNPAVPVKKWLVNKLAELEPFTGPGGARDVRRLLNAGRIAVFLDGLDEVAEDDRDIALRALSDQAMFRLVVLSRSDELAAAAQLSPLVGAVALELCELEPEDAAKYLLSPLVAPAPAPWQKVADMLVAEPDSPLGQTLRNPLNVTLLRDAYRPNEAVDIVLDTDRFPTADDIESHLLDQAVEAAYTTRPGKPSRYSIRTAERALSYMAYRLNKVGTRNLYVLDFAHWRPRALWIGLIGPLLGLIGGVHAGLINGPTNGVLVGVIVWIAVGIVADTDFTTTPAGPAQGNRVELIAWGWRTTVSPGLVVLVYYALMVGSMLLLGVVESSEFPVTSEAVLLATATGVVGVGIYRAVTMMSVDVISNEDRYVVMGFSPVRAWRTQLRVDLAILLGYLTLFGFILNSVVNESALVALATGYRPGTAVIFLAFIGVIAFLGGSRSGQVVTTLVYNWIRRRTPLLLTRFLRDAHDRQVLRTVGSVYQFRHAKLHDSLARKYRP